MKTIDKYLNEKYDPTNTQAELIALQNSVNGMISDDIDSWLYGNEKLSKSIMKSVKSAIKDIEKIMKTK